MNLINEFDESLRRQLKAFEERRVTLAQEISERQREQQQIELRTAKIREVLGAPAPVPAKAPQPGPVAAAPAGKFSQQAKEQRRRQNDQVRERLIELLTATPGLTAHQITQQLKPQFPDLSGQSIGVLCRNIPQITTDGGRYFYVPPTVDVATITSHDQTHD